jgi:hypothetical protein
MMKFERPPEPSEFDTEVRQPGNHWLGENPDKKPKDYWSICKPQLAEGFRNLCGYAAMRIPSRNGTVDHYLTKSKKEFRHLAYEWTNYRYSFGKINSCKSTYDSKILDPFEVEDDWFEILLPSLQLVLTSAIPAEPADLRTRAEFTLKQLQLQNGDWIIEERQNYYDAYKSGEITLSKLEKDAPLIARAVKKQQSRLG